MWFEFESEIWRWQVRADDGWLFVTVPAELSADIREIPRVPRGFGSVRVRARIGATQWSTSIFPGGRHVLAAAEEGGARCRGPGTGGCVRRADRDG
ncbi:DUF1905 domain-containing protein [Microbacterium sp. BWT-B31]|uniref:DUF1905 domain-containing protein n=1 Tax=Microbacterium sp. BWT-B31 TaxID=3232072 RepID=UPI0035286A69